MLQINIIYFRPITSIEETSNNHGDDESSNGGDSYGWADIDDDEIDLDLDDEDDPHQIRLETRMSIAARALRQRIVSQLHAFQPHSRQYKDSITVII